MLADGSRRWLARRIEIAGRWSEYCWRTGVCCSRTARCSSPMARCSWRTVPSSSGTASILLADGSMFLGRRVAASGRWGRVRVGFANVVEPTAGNGSTHWQPRRARPRLGGTGRECLWPRCADRTIHGVFLDLECADTGNVDPRTVVIAPWADGSARDAVTESNSPCRVDDIRRGRHRHRRAPGQFTYVIEAVLADEDETVTPRSNEGPSPRNNDKPVANAQSVTVWEDWLSDPITLAGTMIADSQVGCWRRQRAEPSAQGGTVTRRCRRQSYQSALNFNGPTASRSRCTRPRRLVARTRCRIRRRSRSRSPPSTTSRTSRRGPIRLSRSPRGRRPSPDGRPASMRVLADEDLSQSVLEYIVSTTTTPLFVAAGQPAIAPNGTLTYTPKAGGASGWRRSRCRFVTTEERPKATVRSTPATRRVFTITVIRRRRRRSRSRATDVLVSTSSSNRTYDLKAQILRNGVSVLEKESATARSGWAPRSTRRCTRRSAECSPIHAVGFAATDTLSVRVSSGSRPARRRREQRERRMRLWYNIKTPPGNNSHLHATRAGTAVKYYLVRGSSCRRRRLRPRAGRSPSRAERGARPARPTKSLGREPDNRRATGHRRPWPPELAADARADLGKVRIVGGVAAER